jgi:hypothetical protein
MTLPRTLAGLLALVAFLTLAGCSVMVTPPVADSDIRSFVAPGARYQPTVLVLPPSNRVVGVYPPRCQIVGTPAEPRPDPRCTPGAVRSDITQATIATTICRPGWTKTVRPPSYETNRYKTQAMVAYGVPETERPSTEFDHFVPLALGGSNDVRNLWPQDGPGPGIYNTKDRVEERLNDAVCERRVTLDAARAAIVADWTTALQRTGAGL